MTGTARLLGAAVLLLAALAADPPGAQSAPTYAGRVASASASVVSTGVTLTAGRQVAAGDAILVALRLTGTVTGGIGATDDAGNSYRVDVDQNDGLSLGRLVVLSSANARSLAAGGSIRVTFPSSTGYQISLDEFAGLAANDVNASGWGSSSSFSSGFTSTTSQSVELLYGVVGNESGSAPSWSAGWTGLPTLTLSNLLTQGYLDAAYRVSTSSGQFAASGSISGTWMAGIATYTAASPPDNPPTARLAVSQVSSPALTVRADGSGSSDTDATPIASYRFDFGDGTGAVTTTPPTATAQHTYAAAGTYTVTLIVTDTGGKQSSPATATITVSSTTGGPIAVYAGYYDTHHSYNIKPKPDPWQGSANVVFVGIPDSPSGGWDTSTIRVVNLSAGSITVSVTCDIGSHHFALWSAQAVPAG